MRGGWVVISAALVGCTDANDVEGRYLLDVSNGDDGCQLGWTPGPAFSTELTISKNEGLAYEYLVVFGTTPGYEYLQIAGTGLYGNVTGSELVAQLGTFIEIDTCHYVYGMHMRAEVRPDRSKSLIGRVGYELSTFGPVPGCFENCVSYHEIEGEKD